MKNRDRIIRYYQGTDQGELVARFIDLADSVLRGRPYAISEFVSPGAIQIGETICAHEKMLQLRVFGGYEGAERVRLAFVDRTYEGAVQYDIQACHIRWDSRYRLLSHRDVLGSLMSMGIERSRFGDILMQESDAIVLLDTVTAQCVCAELHKIAMVTVTVEPYSLKDIVPKQEKVKEIKTTVASLRLDAITASGFGISRTKAAEAIKGERVQVNWLPVQSVSREVQVGDVISLRGKGRMEVADITGISRKGRTGVLLKRYM